MPATYEPIASVTLGSNQGTYTFTSIPQTYTDLRLTIRGGFVDNGFMFGMRVGNNGVDANSNYSYTFGRGASSTSSAGKKVNMTLGSINVQGINNLNNVIMVDINNYSNTTTNKGWIGYGTSYEDGLNIVAGWWRSNSAINTIAIAESGDGGSGTFNYGNMLAGTTISLYGIKAA